MDAELAAEIERFIERDGLWDAGELSRCVARLAAAGPGDLAADLAHTFAAVRLRLEMGPVPERTRRDVEGVVYPRLWKVIEAVRDDLPAGEQLARIQVLNRRLARLLVTEDPRSARPPDGEA